MSHRKRRPRFKLKSLYVWHRHVGLSAALLIMLLSITGIALNHTERFNLDSRYVQSAWLLDWYGIEAPQHATHYSTPVNTITLLDAQLFIDAQPLEGEYTSLTGALVHNELLVVGQLDTILLLTPEGQLIERLGHNEGVPPGIQHLGTSADGQLILETATGLYSTDAEYMKWIAWAGAPESINWSTPSDLGADQLAVLQARFRGQILPWERVMLDLHSGRIFGSWGPWVMDTAAILMLFLAGSGVFIWWKKQR